MCFSSQELAKLLPCRRTSSPAGNYSQSSWPLSIQDEAGKALELLWERRRRRVRDSAEAGGSCSQKSSVDGIFLLSCLPQCRFWVRPPDLQHPAAAGVFHCIHTKMIPFQAFSSSAETEEGDEVGQGSFGEKNSSETTRNPPGFSAFQLKLQYFMFTSSKPDGFQGCWFCLHFSFCFPGFSQSAVWPQRAVNEALSAFPQNFPGHSLLPPGKGTIQVLQHLNLSGSAGTSWKFGIFLNSKPNQPKPELNH